MKKNDFIIVAVLVALMFAWMNYYPVLERKFFPKPEQPAAGNAEPAPPLATAKPAGEDGSPPVLEAPAEQAAAIVKAVAEKRPDAVQPSVPEQQMTLANDDIELTVSSYGGAVTAAVLKNYPAENRKDSGPLVLDFASAPALRYDGLPPAAGTLERTEAGLRFAVDFGGGAEFERTLTLDGEYLLRIEDRFINRGAEPWNLPDLRLPTGPMGDPPGATAMQGMVTLGVDTFAPADGVTHWGKELGKLFRTVSGDGVLTSTPELIAPRPVDWIAAKNKFFVQILTPGSAADAFDLSIRREGEGKRAVPVETAGALQFDGEPIGPGETLVRTARLYAGPKDYSFLRKQGMEQFEVMEFKSTGFWKFMNPVMFPLKTGLLWGLKALYGVVRNYGVAIMLLTVIVRIIFWPVTHKGTESMQRMQALQPRLKEIREKHKDNPQRMQQETMAFYKENKINPMGGCLPMLIQIPVFIALFVVLRSAIELRFSKFLWVSDLSEPENLFAGMIPLIGSLNILPLLMAVTMAWQQKLMPSGGGDPQQQKMMAVMMPVMMLFFFYTMPSGLVLYWTTGQVLMIVQMLVKKYRQGLKTA